MLPTRCCENCNTAFIARQANQRFCSSVCGIEFYASERRAAVRAFRQQRSEASNAQRTNDDTSRSQRPD